MKTETREYTLPEALDVGYGFFKAKNFKSAITMNRGVLMHDPANFRAVTQLGAALFEEKQYYEALYWFWRALKINRKHPMALTNYGLCLGMLGHWEESIPFLERSIAHGAKEHFDDEQMAIFYNNLGNTLERMQKYPQALAALDKGLAHCRTDAFPHYNRGIVLIRLGRYTEAIESLNRAMDLGHHPDQVYNRGMALLTLGDFKQGFADYEYRLITSENEASHLGIPGVMNLGLPPDKKLLPGEPINGKTVLVHCEQGLGDSIQFMRFVPLLVEHGATVKMIVHNPVRSLVDMPGVELLTQGIDMPEYDRWIAVMSIPYYLRRIERDEDIIAPWRPRIESARIEDWGAKLIECGVPLRKKLTVGVCWAGNHRHKNNHNRTISIDKFSDLFAAKHCHFVSLQQMQEVDLELINQVRTSLASTPQTCATPRPSCSTST